MPSANFVEIFRSSEFLVKHAHRDAGICVVTFESFADDRSLEREAFAQEFFETRDISAVHIINGANRWYQELALEQVFALLRPTLASYRRVVVYGSSMGGYAALRFANRLRADLVVSISPQYTLAPGQAPFDPRWRKYVRRFRWRRDLLIPLTLGPKSVIIYDPMHTLDRSHVDRVALERAIVRVPIPYSGHPAGTYLAESGLIVSLIMGLIRGNADVAGIVTAARRARRETPAYWMALMMKIQARSIARAIVLGEEALRLHPDVPYLLTHCAMLNMQAHNFDTAVKILRHARKIAPENAAIQYHHARALAAAGRLSEAKQVARRSGPSSWQFYLDWVKARLLPPRHRID